MLRTRRAGMLFSCSLYISSNNASSGRYEGTVRLLVLSTTDQERDPVSQETFVVYVVTRKETIRHPPSLSSRVQFLQRYVNI